MFSVAFTAALAGSIFASFTPMCRAAGTHPGHILQSHPKQHGHKKPGRPAPPKPPAATPAEGENSPPFEPQLLRLSEILGALSYLEPLCGETTHTEWRAQTMALIQAEAKTDFIKETITGAYNHGYQGYALSYRTCTANAEKAISRFVVEGGKLTQDLINRFGAN
jgi:uncharacterized protein (TIGR02301 family)